MLVMFYNVMKTIGAGKSEDAIIPAPAVAHA
jgi:hypothetical protein